MSHRGQDNGFGPVSCLRDFDFTLSFEQCILSILPAALMMLLTPIRLFQLARRPQVTARNGRRLLKLFVASLNVALHLVLVILWTCLDARPTKTSLPSASLSLATALTTLYLSYVEDKKSVRPSTLLVVYMVFSVLFDAVQVRTLWLTSRTNVAAILSAITGVKGLVMLLEEQSKVAYLHPPHSNLPPAATSGILHQTVLWWLNKIFWDGYHGLLHMADLFDLDRGLRADILSRELQDKWDARKPLRGRFMLPTAVLECLAWDLAKSAIPRLALIGFRFSQPFLISAAIEYVQHNSQMPNKSFGYGLIGATALIYLGITVSTVHYQRCFVTITVKFRGAMIALLYNRTLRLPVGLCTESAVLTLMSTDIESIINLLEEIIFMWARIIEVGIGIWLLERQIGAVCLVPLIMTFVCAFGQGIIAGTIGPSQQEWNAVVQARLRDTSSILGSIKAIKMSGLTSTVALMIQNQRVRDLQASRPFFKGITWLNALADVPIIWSPVVSFIVFAIVDLINGTSQLTATKAFTSLSIITLVTIPASKLLAVVPQVAAVLGCFDRLQTYLLSEELGDVREKITAVENGLLVGHQDDHSPAPASSSVGEVRSTPQIAIEIKNATIVPCSKSETAVFRDISLQIQRGCVLILLGPIGTGKSTLLKAILGEAPCVSGSIYLSSREISFCSQTPWLLNTTVKECICGLENTEFDPEWYVTVVRACALDGDMHQWPHGEHTLVGSRGFKLSGGQKQRVALARALYARKQIALLDDVFSALDANTQELVAQRLLSKEGLFRRLGTTVVLSMHTARFLQHADQVIFLDSDGDINTNVPLDDIPRRKEVLPENSNLRYDNEQIRPGKAPNVSESTIKENNDQKKISDDLMETTRQTGDMAVYAYYGRTVRLWLWVAFAFIQLMAAFGTNFPQVWLHLWISSRYPLAVSLSLYAVLGLVALLFGTLRLWIVFLNIMPKAATYLHKVLLDVVMCSPLSFFAATDLGVTLNRFSQDMTLVDLPLPGALVTVTAAFLDFIARIALISTGSSYMAITVPFTVATVSILQHVYLRTSRQLRYLDLENKSPLYSHFLETLDGLPTIRALGWHRAAVQVFEKQLDFSQRPYYLLLSIQQWLNMVLDFITMVLAVIVVTMSVQLRGSTSGSLLGVALNNVLNFNQSLSTLVTSWTSLEASLGAIARIKTFAKTTPNENLGDTTRPPPDPWPVSGSLHVDHATVTYDDGTTALADISFDLSAGKKLGICGRTGSGKSSLILSILRLVNLSEGQIMIDGVNIDTVPREVIRSALISVPQELYTLPGSVRYNADPKGCCLDERIVTTLAKLGIWSTLDRRGGLDAIFSEQQLSQGQQQLFGIARAVLRKNESKILLLDEATSNVDGETDKMIQKVIKEEFHGHTIISIAHRLDTILDSDHVAVFEAGRLVEFDTPGSLLARDTTFRRLYEA